MRNLLLIFAALALTACAQPSSDAVALADKVIGEQPAMPSQNMDAVAVEDRPEVYYTLNLLKGLNDVDLRVTTNRQLQHGFTQEFYDFRDAYSSVVNNLYKGQGLSVEIVNYGTSDLSLKIVRDINATDGGYTRTYVIPAGQSLDLWDL